MTEIDVYLPSHIVQSSVPDRVEQIFIAEGLTITLKGTLTQYKGCIHWHLKRGKERGTLEVTWWEQQNRLWFKIAKGRTGDWIDETIAHLKEQLENSPYAVE